ncbi:MAG: helix-hairpin-helix domain-containing protein [Acidiferrobacterales bacterium]|nr:helix-hairpin-helix domain-containing protein [Acidiferrobacterales bacterium]
MRNPIVNRFAHSRFGVMVGAFVTLFMLATFSVNVNAEQINLNTADAQTLEYIPGIGPTKAKEIVSLRESTNGFQALEDLLAVKGIGEKTLETIRQHGSLNKGVSSLTEEMKNNPAKRITDASVSTNDTSG